MTVDAVRTPSRGTPPPGAERAIDLRSDTVTLPSAEMRRAMAEAEVGDDVLDGDPTTRRLETRVAELLGHEAALFFPTGTQANQVAVGLLGRPGQEMVVESRAHLVDYEEHGATALWGVHLRGVATPDGILRANTVEPVLRPTGTFLPATSAIAIENTHNAAGGRVTDLGAMAELRSLADAHGLPLHIDGARLWNAAVALELDVDRLARLGHTVMVSFSKGLGCPAGSCLAGSTALMERAVVLRRRLGGGMRQSGILAAACLYALDHLRDRLVEDHRLARRLADGLAGHPGCTVQAPDTNIVMLELQQAATTARAALASAGVRLSVFGARRLRAVVHHGVSASQIDDAVATIRDVLR